MVKLKHSENQNSDSSFPKTKRKSKPSNFSWRNPVLIMSLIVLSLGAMLSHFAISNQDYIVRNFTNCAVDATWVGTGAGTTNVSEQCGVLFTYDITRDDFEPQQWLFQTVADADETITLYYEYEGLHAWFRVTAYMNLIVGDEVQPLYEGGIENCCVAPSGGFNTSGSVTFDVREGDTYGFQLGGDNYDINNFLRGTLLVKYLNP